MKRYNGKSIYKGIAIGTVKIFKKIELNTDFREITDTKAEIERYINARDKAVQQLQKIFKKAIVEIGEEAANIFDVQSMMLGDDDYTDSVYGLINDEHANAVSLDKSKILAFVTKYGSSQSHTAILARTMNIPALTGVIIDSDWNWSFPFRIFVSWKKHLSNRRRTICCLQKCCSKNERKTSNYSYFRYWC